MVGKRGLGRRGPRVAEAATPIHVDAVKRLKFAKLNPSASAEKIAEMTGGVEFKLSDDALEASFAARAPSKAYAPSLVPPR